MKGSLLQLVVLEAHILIPNTIDWEIWWSWDMAEGLSPGSQEEKREAGDTRDVHR